MKKLYDLTIGDIVSALIIFCIFIIVFVGVMDVIYKKQNVKQTANILSPEQIADREDYLADEMYACQLRYDNLEREYTSCRNNLNRANEMLHDNVNCSDNTCNFE